MDGQGLPGWVVGIVRWTVAVVALVLLASYAAPRAWTQLQGAVTFDAGGSRDDDDLPAADPADTEPDELVEDRVVARADLAARNGTILAKASETILLGEEGAELMLVGFEPVQADPACLLDVHLEAFLVESTDNRLYVHPAALTEIVDLEDGQALPADAIIEGSTPATAVATGGTSGWLRWNVHDPYVLAHRSAASDALVVLAVSVDAEEGPGRSSVLGTTDSPEDWAPRITWSAVAGCSDMGLGGGVANPDPALEEEAADVTGQGADPDAGDGTVDGDADGTSDEPAADTADIEAEADAQP